MKLFLFFIHYSRRIAILAILAGVISGVSSTGMLAVLNASLRGNRPSTGKLMWVFVALCLVLPLARFISESLLIRLGQGALLELRMRLCRQILATPLRHLEEFGASRLMSSLTDDVPTITNALLAIPVLCINAAVVVAGLIYLGWLSWWVLLLVLCFMAVGITTHQFVVINAGRVMYSCRRHTPAGLPPLRPPS